MTIHDNKCECGLCGNNFVIARWILGIIALALVFALGLKLGELRQELKTNRMMMYQGGMQMDYGQGGYNVRY